MPTPKRPWTAHILELIDMGVIDREEIIRRTIPFVPQGHAYRVRERVNGNMRQRRLVAGLPTNDVMVERTSTEIHRIGARVVVVASLKGLERCGRVVRDGELYRRAR